MEIESAASYRVAGSRSEQKWG